MAEGNMDDYGQSTLSQILGSKRPYPGGSEARKDADMIEFPNEKKRFIGYQSKPNALKLLLEDDETKDVHLTGYDQSEQVSAHKCVLAASSSYFKKMFYDGCKQEYAKDSAVQLDTFPSDIIKDVVVFLYTGRIDVEQHLYSRIYELFKASKFFELPSLAKVCHYFLSVLGEGAIRDESFLHLSAEYVGMLLKLHSLKCNELVLFQALEHWFECQKEVSQETVRELSALIRYHLIPVKLLFEKVRPSKWKHEELVWEAVQHWTDPKSSLKIPHCVSRANMWTLLPMCRGTVLICGINRKGKMAFEVAPPSRYVSERDNCTIVAGFLVALTSLDPPIRFQVFTKGDSSSFSTMPASMNAIALHWSLVSDRSEKNPVSPPSIDLDADTLIPPPKLARTADSPTAISNPVPEPPYFALPSRNAMIPQGRDNPGGSGISSGALPLPHQMSSSQRPSNSHTPPPTSTSSQQQQQQQQQQQHQQHPQQQQHQASGVGSSLYVVHQIDSRMSVIEISRAGRNVLVRSGNHSSTLTSVASENDCYLQMGLQFLSQCTYCNFAVF